MRDRAQSMFVALVLAVLPGTALAQTATSDVANTGQPAAPIRSAIRAMATATQPTGPQRKKDSLWRPGFVSDFSAYGSAHASHPGTSESR
jgi:hypothetical protein